MLKDLYALDDGGASLATGKDLGSSLARAGLPHLLLALLAALPPIMQPRGRAASGGVPSSSPEPEQAAQARIRAGPVVASVKEAAAGLPKRAPYLGYRTDIVAGVWVQPARAVHGCRRLARPSGGAEERYAVRAAVLSHASYRRPPVQREILQLGGIPLMLSQCQVGGRLRHAVV